LPGDGKTDARHGLDTPSRGRINVGTDKLLVGKGILKIAVELMAQRALLLGATSSSKAN
jgi:hypothetical protein